VEGVVRKSLKNKNKIKKEKIFSELYFNHEKDQF
jgi:hypothetical protein